MSNVLTLFRVASRLSPLPLYPAKSWYGLFAVAVLSLFTLHSQAQEVSLAAWDVSGAVNYGESPLTASTAAPNTVTSPLTKGSGVTVPASGAAARAWGGTNWTPVDAASAISVEKFFTFGVAPAAGYRVSFTQIDRLDYRRSGTGPAEGLLQYQVGAGAFTDVGPLSFSSSALGWKAWVLSCSAQSANSKTLPGKLRSRSGLCPSAVAPAVPSIFSTGPIPRPLTFR